jgi:hypothetical protein
MSSAQLCRERGEGEVDFPDFCISRLVCSHAHSIKITTCQGKISTKDHIYDHKLTKGTNYRNEVWLLDYMAAKNAIKIVGDRNILFLFS